MCSRNNSLPSRFDINCSPGKVEIVPIKFEKRKPCPEGPRPHPLTSDPDMFDPRPPQPCNRNPCCACRPSDPPKKPKCYDLKLKLLQDGYNCCMSEKCHERRRKFYDRWQLYLQNRKPLPNYDYKVYCCDDYVDLSENNDFKKNCYFKPNNFGQRERARRNFIWPQALYQVHAEIEHDRSRMKQRDECPCRSIKDGRSKSYYLEAEFHTNHIEPYTIWHEKQLLGPRRFVEGATPVKSRIHPFHKDASFTTPLDQISTGNEPPFKELRDVKVNM